MTRKRRAKREARGALPAMPSPARHRPPEHPPKPAPAPPPAEDAGPDPHDFSDVLEGLELSPREVAFVVAYIENGGNGKAAYMSTFPAAAPATAKVGACKVKSRPHVQEAISRLLSGLVLSGSEVMIQLGELLEDDDAHPIARVKAGELLLKAHGALTPTPLKVEHSGAGGGPVTFSVSEAIKETLGRDHDLDVASQPIPPEDEP